MSALVRRSRGPVVVLAYHAVGEPEADPFGLAVGPATFAGQMAMVARHYEVVPAGAVHAPSERPRVVVTFDDGYASNLEAAAPILNAQGLPATFFMMTPRSSEREMWWDEIVHALAGPPACDFLVVDAGRRITMDVRTPAARAQAVLKLGGHLEVLAPAAVRAVLDSAYAQLGVEPVSCGHHRKLEDPEIEELARSGPFEIGGHTPQHAAFTALDDDEVLDELTASFEHLIGLLGTMPTSFAYPFGSIGYAIAPRHGDLVRRAGFQQAFTTHHGAVPRRFDPYFVPRVQVGSWDPAELRTTIDRAMDAA